MLRCDDNAILGQKNLIAFSVITNPNNKTTLCTLRKIVLLRVSVHRAWRTKYHNRIQGWWNICQYLYWRCFTSISIGLVTDLTRMKRIELHPPKNQAANRWKNHRPCHIQNGTVHKFRLPVAGLVSCLTTLANHTRLLTKLDRHSRIHHSSRSAKCEPDN